MLDKFRKVLCNATCRGSLTPTACLEYGAENDLVFNT